MGGSIIAIALPESQTSQKTLDLGLRVIEEAKYWQMGEMMSRRRYKETKEEASFVTWTWSVSSSSPILFGLVTHFLAQVDSRIGNFYHWL